MKKYYGIYATAGLTLLLLCSFSQQLVEAKRHNEALSTCINKFERIRAEADNIASVDLDQFKQGKLWGYRNSKGKVVIPLQFYEARSFFQGRALVADKNWYEGFINSQGKIVIPYNFVGVSEFANGLAVFSGTRENRERKGFIDLNGNIVLEFRGAHPEPDFSGFKNGRTPVFVYEAEMPWGFLVPRGNPVPKIYGYVDCTGKVTLEQ